MVGELATGATLYDVAAARLRADILAGALAPDAKLRIDELKARYGIGGSPLREALARLVADGLVRVESQRGFSVSGTSRQDLADVTLMRRMVEAEALRLAMQRGDESWEAGIVAAFHLFARRTERDPRADAEAVDRWEAAHKDFHRALIAACGSPRLLILQGILYDQARRYRALMVEQTFGGRAMVDEHRMLVDAVLSRDVERACAAMNHHLGLTLDIYCRVHDEVADRPAGAKPDAKRRTQRGRPRRAAP
jgi:DNA-binding GntR family transcriptional regulator